MTKNTYTLEKYQAEHEDTVLEIWSEANALAHPFLPDEFVARVAKDMRALYLPNSETWLLKERHQPVGFIALVGTEIGGLFLLPSHHGNGLGRMMVDHAVDLHGPLTVEVFQANAIGRHFYDRYGFKQTGEYLQEPTGQVVLQLAMQSS